jgi:hypothetical protein
MTRPELITSQTRARSLSHRAPIHIASHLTSSISSQLTMLSRRHGRTR